MEQQLTNERHYGSASLQMMGWYLKIFPGKQEKKKKTEWEFTRKYFMKCML